MKMMLTPIELVSDIGLVTKSFLDSLEGESLIVDLVKVITSDENIFEYVGDFTDILDLTDHLVVENHIRSTLLDVVVCMIFYKILSKISEDGYFHLVDELIKKRFAFEFSCLGVHLDMLLNEEYTDLMTPMTVLEITTMLNAFIESKLSFETNYIKLAAAALQTINTLSTLEDLNIKKISSVTISGKSVIFILKE